uniref:DNA-directed RNA polymerase n=1 Tax=Zea mays TaxID=4577 RepID=A0A804UJ27_MAIZE
MAVPNYTYLKLKMPGPNRVITVGPTYKHAFECDVECVECAEALAESEALIADLESLSKEALDILGSTKWRVNRRVHDVVETIWSQGGGIAGLVDKANISLPERLESEDPDEMQKWKWSLKKAKKTNRELHAERCDNELKLSDGSCNGLQHYAALGRDYMGAVAVNLVPGEKPADIYSEIASR